MKNAEKHAFPIAVVILIFAFGTLVAAGVTVLIVDASVLTASTPVEIQGTFKQPEIVLVSKELQEKSLAALALGVVLPVVGAVLPFIETGEEDKGPSCSSLIQNAEQAADVHQPATACPHPPGPPLTRPPPEEGLSPSPASPGKQWPSTPPRS